MIRLFLELGVASPEAESLLRGLFVRTAREWLAQSTPGGEPPSDVQVALVTGVHRNFVSQLLEDSPRSAPARETKGHPNERLLDGWHTNPTYLDSSGKPRDLPEKTQEPSFDSLVKQYVPGVAPSVVLTELQRAGLVQLLSDHRVRVRSRTYRTTGLNTGTVSEIGTRTRALLETLIHNARVPDAPLFCESTAGIEIDVERLPMLRELMARRASTFLSALAHEFSEEVRSGSRKSKKSRVKVGLTVFQTERPSES